MTKTPMMSELLQVITASQFLLLTKEAAKAHRRRSHLLLHSGHTDQVRG